MIPMWSDAPRLQADIDFDAVRIRSRSEYTALKDELLQSFPALFDDLDDYFKSFTVQQYIDTFLEEVLYQCGYADDFSPTGAPVKEVMDELERVLTGAPGDFVVARLVSHLTTESGASIELEGIRVIPDQVGSASNIVIRRQIPDSAHVLQRRPSVKGLRPRSLLVLRQPLDTPGFHTGRELSRKLDHFILIASLLTNGTAQPVYEVTGMSTAVTQVPARLRELMNDGSITVARRVIRLNDAHGPALDALSALVRSADPGHEGKIHTSFGLALKKFGGFDHTTDAFEQLVDLATALEGVMVGTNEGEGLTLRLCTRVSALLAADDDSARGIFGDVKALYGLRSTIVHGGELTEKALRKTLASVSTTSDTSNDVKLTVNLGYAIDRLRDIVRRAILARLCLATGPDPIPHWPLGDKPTAVDAILSDDSSREVWRSYWRTHLAEIGVGEAANRATAVEYALSRSER